MGYFEQQCPVLEVAPLRILLAEDQDINLIFATRILERFGHYVVAVQNGQVAVERWGEEFFDLILMDIQMPVMDGIDATRAIRAKEAGSGRRIPIIAVTGRVLREELEHIMTQGFDSYLIKPFAVNELIREIGRY